MESKMLYLVAACCLPSVLYLFYIVGKAIRRLAYRGLPGLRTSGAAQLILVMLSVFCCGMSLFLVTLNFVAQIPYYHRERSLVVALLFLLMGILGFQVFQFVRSQSQRPKTILRPGVGSKPYTRRRAVRNKKEYVVSNTKG